MSTRHHPLDGRKQMLSQQNITIIRAIHLVPGSTNTNSVLPRLDTAADTITDREKVERVFTRRSAGTCFLRVADATQGRSFWRFIGGATVKTFSSENNMNGIACSGYFLYLFASKETCKVVCSRQILTMMST